MGFLQNLRPSFLEALGQQMRHGFEKGLEIFGKAKELWETGKAICMGVRPSCLMLMTRPPLFHIYCKY
jgi:hypothetical protein